MAVNGSRPASPASPASRGLRACRNLGRTVTFRLHTLAKLTDRVSQQAYVAETGLPLGEGRCLSAIGSFRPLSVIDLAARANLDKGQASRAAQSLVDRGLVRKQASALDGRGVVLTLTAKGQRLWQRVMDLVQRRNAEITACLTAAERAQLDRLLDRLVAHARDVAADDSAP
jgi:DNA-binding MarR family transcriptional regulator